MPVQKDTNCKCIILH